MINLNKHKISANIKDRYGIITYAFDFENNDGNTSTELKFEITIDPNAFISQFEANIDGIVFIGETKDKHAAAKEYATAKTKHENAVLICQPHNEIPNVFQIKTNIDAKSTVSLTIQIEQYLQKTFSFNQLNIQILRDFSAYNIKPQFDSITFQFSIQDGSGIYDVNIPLTNAVYTQTMDNKIRRCDIAGRILNKSDSDLTQIDVKQWINTLRIMDKLDVRVSRTQWCIAEIVDLNNTQMKVHYIGYETDCDEYIDLNSDRLAPLYSRTRRAQCNELMLKYKIKGEENESRVLFDRKSNTFCHIISHVMTHSLEGGAWIPRRVVFVLDQSSSMSGLKWVNTVSATIMGLKQLRAGYDRFGVILFAHGVEVLLDEEMVLAQDDIVSHAIDLLHKKHIGGNTNINKALLKSIQMIQSDIMRCDNDALFMNHVIFITDGEANSGETNTKQILMNVNNANDGGKISIFAFGVGQDGNNSQWIHDLNHSFLKLLSLNNNGFYKRIKTSFADTSLAQYFRSISQAKLSNITVQYKNKNVTDLTETKFNALYDGSDLIICGKMNSKNDYFDVILSGIAGKRVKEKEECVTKARLVSREMRVDIEAVSASNIERIWAYLKLQELAKRKLLYDDMIQKDEDEQKEEDALPLSLALKYKFVTPWTSMIVVKEKDECKEDIAYVSEEVEGNEIGQNQYYSAIVTTSSNTAWMPSRHYSRAHGGYKTYSGYTSIDCDDIEPQERYSSCDVVCAAEFVQNQKGGHLEAAECKQKSMSHRKCTCLIICICLIIVIVVVLSVTFSIGL
eukprot:824828_1